MDFKSFHKNRKTEPTIDDPNEAEIKKTAEKYAQKSDEELLGDIMKTAGQNRANGVLSDAQLQQFAESVSPMLNAEQKARLEKAIQMIRGN